MPKIVGSTGIMVAARPRPACLEKLFSSFQGFAVRADLRGSDNRRGQVTTACGRLEER